MAPLSAATTELTTAATDAAMAFVCVAALGQLVRLRVAATWKRALWVWVLALLGAASALGAVTHGLAWPETVRAALWPPLYLLLGITVALFVAGAVCDWRGEALARRALPWAIAIGAGFFAVVELAGGAFVIFVIFETASMLTALAMYASSWAAGRLAGAGLVTLGIGLTIAAGAVQATTLSLRLVVPFDHNGLFHIVQIAATIVLAIGLRRGLARG